MEGPNTLVIVSDGLPEDGKGDVVRIGVTTGKRRM
jgi:hypothetical protein